MRAFLRDLAIVFGFTVIALVTALAPAVLAFVLFGDKAATIAYVFVVAAQLTLVVMLMQNNR